MAETDDLWASLHEAELSASAVLDCSLVELVLAVSECTEDEGEILDRVDELILGGRVHLERLENAVPDARDSLEAPPILRDSRRIIEA